MDNGNKKTRGQQPKEEVLEKLLRDFFIISHDAQNCVRSIRWSLQQNNRCLRIEIRITKYNVEIKTSHPHIGETVINMIRGYCESLRSKFIQYSLSGQIEILIDGGVVDWGIVPTEGNQPKFFKDYLEGVKNGTEEGTLVTMERTK